eukprot:7390848-Prymnesium_polylepis.1
MSIGSAEPSPAPSFALISPATIRHRASARVIMTLTLPSDRASCAAKPELLSLNTSALGTQTATSKRGGGLQAALALWWRSECVHSSLAKDAAATADGVRVAKSLTAAQQLCVSTAELVLERS